MHDSFKYRKKDIFKNLPPDKIRLTSIERILEVLDLAIILGVGIFYACVWGALPAKIPSHYDVVGRPDVYSGKSVLLMLMGIMLFMFVVLTFVRHNPKIWDMSFYLPKEKLDKLYSICAGLISCVKFLITVIFGYLCVMNALVAMGMVDGIDRWFAYVTALAVFISIGISVVMAFNALK